MQCIIKSGSKESGAFYSKGQSKAEFVSETVQNCDIKVIRVHLHLTFSTSCGQKCLMQNITHWLQLNILYSAFGDLTTCEKSFEAIVGPVS